MKNSKRDGIGSKDQKLTLDLSRVGFAEWFHMGEYERVEKVISDLRSLGVTFLRIGVSWADWHTDEGQKWYSWLFPRLAGEVSLLPCFTYTPPSMGTTPHISSPPHDPKAFADFVDQMITLFGNYFNWVELWNEPNNLAYWDWHQDADWEIFCRMIGMAAYWTRQRGKKTILAGMCPTDTNWLRVIASRGVLEYIDVIGIHGFPGTWEHTWKGWEAQVSEIKSVLRKFGMNKEIWITETGYSTWRYDERQQVQHFLETLQAPVSRIFWYSLYDLDPELPDQHGLHTDERYYHCGIRHSTGFPKLLYRLWVHKKFDMVNILRTASSSSLRPPYTLITGGAGFIGTNLAHRLLTEGKQVMILDNLSRNGVEDNIEWLKAEHGKRTAVTIADIRDPQAVRQALAGADGVFHFAAQVAVTTSICDPVRDFETNIRGTMNILEEMRKMVAPPPIIYTSTNKVYGSLGSIELHRNRTRYEPADPEVKAHGISETRQLDLHSPYGCSKGAADQYILDYSRTFNLPAVVFRMSCIYGPHQCGNEDQGWVAHFLINALEGRPITIYGDGLQVRDVLYVDDLIDAFLLARKHVQEISGQAFNIGGGPVHTVSLIELIHAIKKISGRTPALTFDSWRQGDQLYYVSDTTRFREATGWAPRVPVMQGVRNLHNWLTHIHFPVTPVHTGRKAS